MKRTAVFVVLALLVASAALAATYPTYQNMDRKWGTVSQVYSTTSSGLPWVAFVLSLPDGSAVRFDCGTSASALGCTAVKTGTSLLVSGHSETSVFPSCRWDGPDYTLVPNVIWDCTSGACVQLTP